MVHRTTAAQLEVLCDLGNAGTNRLIDIKVPEKIKRDVRVQAAAAALLTKAVQSTRQSNA